MPEIYEGDGFFRVLRWWFYLWGGNELLALLTGNRFTQSEKTVAIANTSLDDKPTWLFNLSPSTVPALPPAM